MTFKYFRGISEQNNFLWELFSVTENKVKENNQLNSDPHLYENVSQK